MFVYNYVPFAIHSTVKKIYKILNTFLIPFSNKMLVFWIGTHKMLVRTANREDPDQTAFPEAV